MSETANRETATFSLLTSTEKGGAAGHFNLRWPTYLASNGRQIWHWFGLSDRLGYELRTLRPTNTNNGGGCCGCCCCCCRRRLW
jgi:hypothetical protein